MQNETQVGCELSTKEPKYTHLLSLIHQVNEVRDHVRNLHGELGVISQPQPSADQKEQEAPCNLVDVIGRLPGMVSRECSEIHNLLNEIKESLI